MDSWKGLKKSPISARYTEEGEIILDAHVAEEISELPKCIGSIDGKVIEIDKPDYVTLKNV